MYLPRGCGHPYEHAEGHLLQYGAHNLSDQFGDHYVLNNQYGSGNATAPLCNGYNGDDCVTVIELNEFGVFNLTPINSVVMNRP
ncbi:MULTISPECIES: hypothetical protein [Streptomyces]|uniref:hypothetical protein n=1 Tax=Streptomyces TaxID=1883 RepID=UPI0022590378|nr:MULTISPECIES: hypothetical protein [Streptomyces]MCX4430773.1 hypothetical protein [Streptomyces mirabilis]